MTPTNLAHLHELLEARDYPAFMRAIDEISPPDAAEWMEKLPAAQLLPVFRMLKKDTAAEIFAELDHDAQQTIIEAITDRELGAIIEELFVDDAVDMLEELPAGVVKRVLAAAQPETRARINQFLSYPEDSAGSVMTAEFLDLRGQATVTEAIDQIRRTHLDRETVHMAYITDETRHLQGVLDVTELLFAPPDATLASLMRTEIITAATLDDRETAAEKIAKYDLLALPIVDTEGRLVGIVTVDDALDVIEEEATEDIEVMAAITPTDRPYSKTGVLATYRKRIPWLLLLMISATFTGAIISAYEEALQAAVVLTSFIPMLMDTGGNAGGQASVTIIRALSLGEITIRDLGRILFKELRVALLCGVTLAAAAFGKVLLVDRNAIAPGAVLATAGIVALSMLCAVIVAKLIGATLPILARQLRLDPAVMASPFITTIVDAVALMLYFAIAQAMLGI